MLSQGQRTTILELSAAGMPTREIARVMQLSRQSVRKVLRSKSTDLPEIHRPEKAEPWRSTNPRAFDRLQGESGASP